MRVLISVGKGKNPANYRKALEKAGITSVALYAPTSLIGFDGLLLAGGEDMDPAFYGQTLAGSHTADVVRDRAELELIRQGCEYRLPIFGICRGIQVINVAFGGTLVQHLPSVMAHQRNDGDVRHWVRCSGKLCELFGQIGKVNSCHHQAVGRVADGFSVTAQSGDVIEGLAHNTLPIFAVQFHPERMGQSGDKIFSYFADLLRQKE